MKRESALPGAVSVFAARVRRGPAWEGSGSGCEVSRRPGRGGRERVGAPGGIGRPRPRREGRGRAGSGWSPGRARDREKAARATRAPAACCARARRRLWSAPALGGAGPRRPPPRSPIRALWKTLNTDERRK